MAFINLGQVMYPVGSIYMSWNPISPGDLFGGDWIPIDEEKFLLASQSHTAGTTGGEKEHKLTVSEMPSHAHKTLHSSGTANTWGYRDAKQDYTVFRDSGYMEKTGGDMAHNNMPPYITCYMWRRHR